MKKSRGERLDELVAFLEGLKNDPKGCDPEYTHPAADQALLKFIDHPRVTAAFDALKKWYA